MRARGDTATFRNIVIALIAAGALALGGCAPQVATTRTPGPAEILLAKHTHLKLPRPLVFLPPAEAVRLMHHLGERPGAEVLGAVVTHGEDVPRMLILFAGERDARGVPKIDVVGWDEVPAARSFINELLLAQPDLLQRN